jgi:antitoxin MazE
MAHTHLISIGNSKGIRIPKSIIKDAGLENAELELKVLPEGLLITSVCKVRQGWAEACQILHDSGEDKLLLDKPFANQFDKDEWEW